MNPEKPEPCPSQATPLQALSLSNIAEGMGHNIKRACTTIGTSSEKHLIGTNNSWSTNPEGKEALLTDIMEQDMTYQTQVMVLSQLHLHKPMKLNFSLMKYDIFQLCWRSSKLSWRESRSGRARFKKCILLDILHHATRNYTGRYSMSYLVLWMPDDMWV